MQKKKIMTQKNKTITIRVNNATEKKLEKISVKKNTTKSEIIRKLIENMLDLV